MTRHLARAAAALLLALTFLTAPHAAAAAFAPSCTHFTSGYGRSVCNVDVHSGGWAYAGTFNGHTGCWQATGDPDVGTVFDCPTYHVAETPSGLYY